MHTILKMSNKNKLMSYNKVVFNYTWSYLNFNTENTVNGNIFAVSISRSGFDIAGLDV